MKRKYLRKFTALLALGLTATACSHFDTDFNSEWVEQNYQENFSSIIGEVNPNQDFNLFTTVKANITVNLGLAEEYTVRVFDGNPYSSSTAGLLAAETVKEGGTINLEFTAEAVKTQYYVGAFDKKGRGLVEAVNLGEDGTLQFNFGGSSANTRAVESDYTGSYAKTAADYLNGKTIAEMEAYTPFNDDDVEKFKEVSNANYNITSSYVTGHMEGTPGYYVDGYNEYDENGNWVRWVPGYSVEGDEHWVNEDAYFNGGDGHHYRIPAGTVITKPIIMQGKDSNWQTTYDGAVLYIQGTLHLSTENNFDGGTLIVVANGGEIIIDEGTNNIKENSRFVVLPGGKITGTNGGGITVTNGPSCYNGGTINFNGKLDLNGCNFYNNGTVNVDILTGTSDGSYFTNFGKITARTNEQSASAYNQVLVNGCYMHYTESAGLGNMILLDNSRLDVDGQLLLTGDNTLYNLSEINAGSIYWNNGIVRGPSSASQFAVVKTNKSLISHADDLNAYNYVYFDMDMAEFYNYQGVKEDLNNNYGNAHHVIGGDNGYGEYWCKAPIRHWINEAKSPFIIPAGECTGNGYSYIPKEEEDKTEHDPIYYTIAFEDLGSTDDFDFNDAVLEIDWYAADGYYKSDPGVKKSANTADVKLVAQGGTLSITISYDGTELFAKSDGIMRTGRAVYAQAKGISLSHAQSDLGKFSLNVVENGQTSTVISSANVKGEAPQALVIPGQWHWPTERTSITEAYSSFANWVSGSTATDWYKNPTGSIVGF